MGAASKKLGAKMDTATLHPSWLNLWGEWGDQNAAGATGAAMRLVCLCQRNLGCSTGLAGLAATRLTSLFLDLGSGYPGSPSPLNF